LIVDFLGATGSTNDQRFHLAIIEEDHETPVAAQEVAPELVTHFLAILAELRALNVRFFLAHVKLFV
jgi:hypothetical protein